MADEQSDEEDDDNPEEMGDEQEMLEEDEEIEIMSGSDSHIGIPYFIFRRLVLRHAGFRGRRSLRKQPE